MILVAPSRCGKTPTTMYLALQHGLLVANYPLVDEDFETAACRDPIRGLRRPVLRADHHPGPAQPGAAASAGRTRRYASLEQCTFELRRAEALYRGHRIPSINSSTKSVEEMSTVIMQSSACAASPDRPAHPESTIRTDP